MELSRCIAQNHPFSGEKQLLVDISHLVHQNLKTGIERTVENILAELVDSPPEGFRVEPVYAALGGSG